MTPEQFAAYIAPSEVVVPNNPRFERQMLIKYGKNIVPKSYSKEVKDKREASRMARGHGKLVNQVNNLVFDKVLTAECSDCITGVIRSLEVASTHNGSKVLSSVLVHMLTTYPILHRKLLEWDYGYSTKHADTYMKALESCVLFLGQLDLEDIETDDGWDDVEDWDDETLAHLD